MNSKLKKGLTGSEIRKAVGKENLELLLREENLKNLLNTLNHIERGCIQEYEYEAIEKLVSMLMQELDMVSSKGYKGQENEYTKTLRHSPDEWV